ncbi:MAG: hypothetical protein AB7O24_29525 [Kofleriaceae bacterium]
METVKIDVQKLQLLNERIAQTIDALNQVRLSMHGVQQTAPFSPLGYGYSGYSPYGVPSTNWTQNVGAFPLPVPFTSALGPQLTSPFVAAVGNPFLAPFVTPFPHQLTAPASSPIGPFGSPFGSPFAAPFGSPFAAPFMSPFGGGPQHVASSIGQQQPFGSVFGGWPSSYSSNGIGHSPWDGSWQSRASTPFTTTQTPS